MLYSRYLFNKTAISFFGIITILILLIWFSRAIGFVKYITENGVELSQFFYLFVLILPWLLLILLPISLFAAIIATYNRMITSNEISILKNSGLTKFQICKPVLKLSAIAFVFCLAISLFFMPYANKQLRISRNNIQDNYTNLSFNPHTFETLKDLTIYAKDRDKENKLSGIFLHDKRPESHSITITAKSGKIIIENKSALLFMEEGTVQKYNYVEKKSEILHFDNYVFNLTENQKNDREKFWKPQERYLQELINPQDEYLTTDDLNEFRAEIHKRFIYPLLSPIFSLIALAFILSGQFSRHGNIGTIIGALVAAAAFLSINIVSLGLIESSAKFSFMPYLNCLIFVGISSKMLIQTYRQKS
jgi:lipopolysaccharide export system permease protein